MLRINGKRYLDFLIRCSLPVLLTLHPCCVFASQQVLPANRKIQSKQVIADIALKPDGSLVGQVVDANGVGIAAAPILLSNVKSTSRTRTDSAGWFQFSKVRGGTYQFESEGRSQLVRAWQANAAPPRANTGLLVTPQSDVFRGQRVLSPNVNQFFRVSKQRLANPLVVTGVALTAVAIPVAIHNSDDDSPATP